MKPKTSYIICATPRSGSHLLSEALQNTKLAGKPDEYFITDPKGNLQNETGNIAEKYGQMTLEEFRRLIIEIGSTPNGVFGISILWGDFHNIVKNYQSLPQYQNLNEYEMLDALFHNPKYIWLTRRDKVRQAVSLAKAIQTNIWRKSTHEKFKQKREPVFNYDDINFRYKRLVESDQSWEQFFQKKNVTPFKVVYEDLVENYEQTALALLDYLEISHPEKIDFGERRLQKQADKLSEEWVAQYRKIKNSPLSPIIQWWLTLKRRIRRISVRQMFRK